ncbi:prolipoprotein diacylglyceryl transferase [Papillibacter cinnamivorans]|uniref:Phosphatidylglycerol--prolipoprotein diacylglyceryl transferase n=1 Tax=Papillibacter cinnamivorans DSM 12816 TaxID=1122930 RepID=A0A1W1ZBA0_9FIRM|nr:prolipoprotein diacylglyceryl transferase [Papillibacter cinnamivorans]SMC45695.1 phosphatidylglycerol:prolipoprotein diacylglycerol transferase [Papillibacter cinnamivorans DSM 12816]
MNHTPIQFPGLGLSFNPDRVAFTLFGHDIYWYGIIIAAGFLLAVLYTYKRAHRFGVKQDDFLDLLLYAVPIAIVGSRIYYVIFYFSLYQYQDNGVTKVNWAEIFRIWDGGLAVYGSIIAAVITAFIFCRIKKISFGAVADLGALGLLIGQAVGRWGNFINREAFGALTDLPWRMGVVPRGGSYVEVHPTFLYESLWNVIGFFLLASLSKRRKFNGQIFLLYVAWYGFGRGLIEGLRTDSLYLWGTGLRVSQVVGFVSCAAALIIYFIHRRVKLSKLTATGGAGAEAATAAEAAPEAGLAENGSDNGTKAETLPEDRAAAPDPATGGAETPDGSAGTETDGKPAAEAGKTGEIAPTGPDKEDKGE